MGSEHNPLSGFSTKALRDEIERRSSAILARGAVGLIRDTVKIVADRGDDQVNVVLPVATWMALMSVVSDALEPVALPAEGKPSDG